MFALVPDADARTRTIKFWNYNDLETNKATPRDWSKYLHESGLETEFKFGTYAQNNYLQYAPSDDVKLNSGRGTLHIDDYTMPAEKTVVELPVSTCNDYTVTTDQSVSRIATHKYSEKDLAYLQQTTIDARIVFLKEYSGSKYFAVFAGLTGVTPSGAEYDLSNYFQCKSLDISFSNLLTFYQGLANILNKTNVVTCLLYTSDAADE